LRERLLRGFNPPRLQKEVLAAARKEASQIRNPQSAICNPQSAIRNRKRGLRSAMRFV